MPGTKPKQEGELARMAGAVLLGALTALGTSLALLCLVALAISRGGLGEGRAELALLAVSLVSVLIGGCLAAARSESRRLPVALATAVAWYALWLAAGGIFFGGVSLAGGAARLLAGAAGGLLAGIFAARPKKRRK